MHLRCFFFSKNSCNLRTLTLWQIFGLKIWSYKFFDKFQVCYQLNLFPLQLSTKPLTRMWSLWARAPMEVSTMCGRIFYIYGIFFGHFMDILWTPDILWIFYGLGHLCKCLLCAVAPRCCFRLVFIFRVWGFYSYSKFEPQNLDSGERKAGGRL